MTFAVRPPFASNPKDPYYSMRSLGLHFDGADGSTTFTDSSPNPKTPSSVGGNAQITTAQSVFGQSGLFDGNGDIVFFAANADFVFGSGDFTVSMYVRPTVINADKQVFSYGNETATAPNQSFGLAILGATLSTGTLRFFCMVGSTQYSLDSASPIAINQFTHVEVTRFGNTLRMFFNGIQVASISMSGTINNPSSSIMKIGRYVSTLTRYFAGNIDDFLIYKGVALHTADFAPPSRPFPNS